MDSRLEKYQTGSVSHIVHQDKFQIEQKSKCKPKHISTERKHGDYFYNWGLEELLLWSKSLEAIKEKIDKLGNIKIKEHPLEKESNLFLSLTYTQRKPTIDEVKT